MKKILAAAVAAAVIAPATTMAAGPTLYGQLHMSLDHIDNGGSGAAGYSEMGLNSNSSRIGVKGSEDLGNGMKVGYLIEWGVDMDGDAGSNDLTQRNRAITLSGDFGTALAGKWTDPVSALRGKVDLFGDTTGDLRNMTAMGGDASRYPNVVAYVTPNMSGFTATVAYITDADGFNSAGEYSDDNSDDSAWAVNGIYKNGPLMLGGGYRSINVEASGMDDIETVRLVGSYAMGDFKVLASYTDVDGTSSATDSDAWSLGASYKMGNNTLKAQYADRDMGGDNQSDMWVVGVYHAMSKRTSVYGMYADVSNDDAGNRSVSSNPGHGSTVTTVTGEDSDALSFGIIHKF